MIFDENGDIWFRQSWLDTAMRCGERGRLAITKPEWDSKSSDSAIIGTGAHAGFEADLNGATEPFVIQAIKEAIEAEVEQGVKWTKYSTVGEMYSNAIRCYEAWVEGIKPTLVLGGHTEVSFKVPLFTLGDGRQVGVTGTIDYVPPGENTLWDWKTAASKFRPKEKQQHAIQPSIYTLAAVKGGLASVTDYEYRFPMEFHYGIAVRGVKKSTPQIVTVRRTQAHADFAVERIKSYVDFALNFGLERAWPRDDDHFLCNATWCPWWSICKGAFIHQADDVLPTSN